MITTVVLAKNEEENIVDCLESLSFCDEIIVIDDNSEDRTREIAQKMGTKVFTHSLDNDFSKQRNFGLEKARGDWVLFVDADERASRELKEEIKSKIKNDRTDGYLIKRIDTIWERKLRYGETRNIVLLRLGRKNKGNWIGKVHEEWKIEGRIDILKSHLDHYPHPTVSEFLKKINFYTDLRAKELFEKGVRSNFFSILFYPTAKFLSNYFLKLGFMDGVQGLIFALMMSFHSFLVRGKLWLLINKKNG
ncbi:MAG: hypothetical protein A3B44_01290 [Candidatus Levybacteria bacterium RIFCSPLOWO2_01_FULL_38_21]|nr:MAG: hypothetical protein A3B44_01290 [Candidatus Levybacteria bacterium RIFCSPLOWO2_01_FULL_38_21]